MADTKQAERYDDMASAMKLVTETGVELSNVECNLLGGLQEFCGSQTKLLESNIQYRVKDECKQQTATGWFSMPGLTEDVGWPINSDTGTAFQSPTSYLLMPASKNLSPPQPSTV